MKGLSMEDVIERAFLRHLRQADFRLQKQSRRKSIEMFKFWTEIDQVVDQS